MKGGDLGPVEGVVSARGPASIKGRPSGDGNVADRKRHHAVRARASMKGRPFWGGDARAEVEVLDAERASMKGRPLGDGDLVTGVNARFGGTPR